MKVSLNRRRGIAVVALLMTTLVAPALAGRTTPNRRTPNAPAGKPGFAGQWITTYGVLTLRQQSGRLVTGSYDHGGGGTLDGRVVGRSLFGHYDDAQNQGDVEFSLGVDGHTLIGRFRVQGTKRWHDWIGYRSGSDQGFEEATRECNARKASGTPHLWDGQWKSTYGLLSLRQRGNTVTGSYPFQGRVARVSGRIMGRCLAVQYVERDAAGLAVWIQDPRGDAFRGVWKAYGAKGWTAWVGKRVPAGSRPVPKRAP